MPQQPRTNLNLPRSFVIAVISRVGVLDKGWNLGREESLGRGWPFIGHFDQNACEYDAQRDVGLTKRHVNSPT
jgi:hypothetical protein